MTKEELRIIYMGTPDFAVETLRLLVERGYNVVAVLTMPDVVIKYSFRPSSSMLSR